MLFNSSVFLLQFLPLTFVGYAVFSVLRWRRTASLWLTLASFTFYGWWNPTYVPLLLGSIIANYLLAGVLMKRQAQWLLIGGVAANLLMLGFYKYTNFGVHVINQLTAANWSIPEIVLPLAISFFTFQQIAYLCDAYDQTVVEHDFLNYCLFITFFPQLIAGPIAHHREMLVQFTGSNAFRVSVGSFSVGITVFMLGLAKKVIIADPFGQLASPVFDAAGQATGALPLLASWMGALAYTIQIYFDFSGYTDMAIGLALMFNVQLPQNFNSPYKARNVIDYWNRWHMSLTRFLTAYIYNPLVLNATRRRARQGLPLPRRGRMAPGVFVKLVALPTIITLFLSGVWHGAGWQFLAFGLLHGAYLVANHGWRTLKLHWGWTVDSDSAARRLSAVCGTFLCVVIAMVFFRASSVGAAGNILQGMFGWGDVTAPRSWFELPGIERLMTALNAAPDTVGLFRTYAMAAIPLGLAIVWLAPNVGQLMLPQRIAMAVELEPTEAQKRSGWFWRPTKTAGVVLGVVSFCALVRALSVAPTEFLYFKF